jgi:hypothetical protein
VFVEPGEEAFEFLLQPGSGGAAGIAVTDRAIYTRGGRSQGARRIALDDVHSVEVRNESHLFSRAGTGFVVNDELLFSYKGRAEVVEVIADALRFGCALHAAASA